MANLRVFYSAGRQRPGGPELGLASKHVPDGGGERRRPHRPPVVRCGSQPSGRGFADRPAPIGALAQSRPGAGSSAAPRVFGSPAALAVNLLYIRGSGVVARAPVGLTQAERNAAVASAAVR
ncbi:hypothetical protein MAHJHV47_30230 [Mycobacterium avium subsp. hominissuis]